MYIRGEAELQALCGRARDAGRLGLDVEFIREKTYFPQLALVQVAVAEDCFLIDPLVEQNLDPLEQLIFSADVLKVMHAPTQDLEIFFHRTGELPARIFDTQIAAAMLGIGNQISYGALVESSIGTRLRKGESFTNWLRRPLSRKQEEYALDDVRYLLRCHDSLSEALQKKGRWQWAEEEFERYSHRQLYWQDAGTMYLRVKRANTLDHRSLAVLRELVTWREEEARQRDRPRRSVMADEMLVELARAQPRSVAELEGFRGIHPRDARRAGREILAAIQRGLELPEEQCPRPEKRRRPPAEAEVMMDFLQACMKARCQEAGISPTLVGNAASVKSLVLHYLAGDLRQQGISLLEGWRGELIGEHLVSFLEGREAVWLDRGQGGVVFEPRDASQ